MKRDTVNYVLVGAFVVVMAIAFVVLLFAVTGRTGPTDSYYVYYRNVAGLKFGTGVFYEGYPVGQVEDIEPVSRPEGMRYRVELSIASGWRIPADSVASVQSSGFISAVTIQISEGRSQQLLAPGDTLPGRGQTDMFAMLNQAANDFHELSQQGMLPLLQNVNLRVSELADEMLRFRHDELTPLVRMLHERLDRDIMDELQRLLQHLDESALGLKAMVGPDNQARVGDFLVHLDSVAVDLVELVGRIGETRSRLDGVLAGIDAAVEDNAGGVRRTVGAAERSMVELETALRAVNQHLGTILRDVEGSARHMNEFARAIRDNPARIIRSSDGAEPGAP